MTSASAVGVSMTSRVDTTFGCRIREASRASSMSIIAKERSLRRCACGRLTATVRANPEAPSRRAKKTAAIPPEASSRWSTYRPRVTGRVGAIERMISGFSVRGDGDGEVVVIDGPRGRRRGIDRADPEVDHRDAALDRHAELLRIERGRSLELHRDLVRRG